MKHSVLTNTLCFATAALITVAATGCGRSNIKVYKVDTNDLQTTVAPPPAQGQGMGSMNSMPSSMPAGLPTPDKNGLPALKYTVPSGWQEKAPSTMRVASFSISEGGKQVDVSVIPLGGLAGGDLANVNRWLGQVGQQPITDDQLPKLTENVQVAGEPAGMYDLSGKNPDSGNAERIIAAILHRDDTAWFFKMTGDSDLVEQNKAAFVEFLKSVQFGAPSAISAPAAMDMSQLPPSHPPIGGMSMNDNSMPVMDTPAAPQWTVPSGWEKGPLEQFLVAKFIVPGTGDAKAEVNVSSLNGSGGGLLANVNRWRQQIELAPISDSDPAKLQSIDTGSGKAALVDFSGTNPTSGKATELIGVVLPLGSDTWFYKMMGDSSVVTGQKDAFIKFVQSAKYSGS